MSTLLEQASLVMIPSGYKEDVVYSQIPTNGNGDLSFTRASNGTRVNSAGLVEDCPWNLVTYSSVLSDSSYNIGEVTASYSQTDPNGGTTGALFTGVSATNAFIIKPFTTIIGQVYTCFVYLKGNSSGSVSLRAEGATSAPVNNVNYTTSYQQFTYTFTADSTTTNLIIGGYGSWTGSEAIYVAFPQANIGSTAKPYFPTTDRLNVPRLTYQNGGGGCPSLLLEKQSTNLVTYSEQFDNVAWAREDVTNGANITTSPDGTQNADTIIDNSTTNRHINYQSFSGDLSTARTLSVYAKQNSLRYLFLSVTNAGDSHCYSAIFDLQTGTVSATKVNGDATLSASIESVGTGYYRCIISGTMTSGTASFFPLIGTSNRAGFTGSLNSNNAPSYTGSGQSLYVWGAQLEASSYPTSYIPTTSASATRVLDECSKTGISSLIGQTSGAAFIEFNSSFLESYTQRIFTLSDGTTNNVIGFQLTGANELVFYVENGGTNQVVISKSSPAITLGSNVKIAAAYANNDFVFYVNGTQIGTDTSGSVPATSQVRFSEGNASAFYLGLIKQIVLFKTRLTNAELASLTTI
jgi:hypothetical protein